MSDDIGTRGFTRCDEFDFRWRNRHLLFVILDFRFFHGAKNFFERVTYRSQRTISSSKLSSNVLVIIIIVCISICTRIHHTANWHLCDVGIEHGSAEKSSIQHLRSGCWLWKVGIPNFDIKTFLYVQIFFHFLYGFRFQRR